MQGVATKGRANHPQWVPGLPLESRVAIARVYGEWAWGSWGRTFSIVSYPESIAMSVLDD